jgi:hypothetical protein
MKTKKAKIIIVGCFYLNVLIAMCSCAFYAGAVEKHQENKDRQQMRDDVEAIFDSIDKPLPKRNK